MTEAWIERWQEGRTGWHEAGGNAGLKKHWRATGRRVFVPLCGKTPDMAWLAEQGNTVVGVELSELAVRAFFDEQQLSYDIIDGGLPAYRANEKPITIYCGDFFALREVACDAHYDRGALIALPREMRPAYVEHVNRLIPGDVERLVITLEYDQSIAKGPPFSVAAGELLSYWPGLELAESHDDIENGPPKFLAAGLREMIESVWVSGESH
ncbi:MAG: thiopurine S-methyltransferase [Woeseiaceae bacterium]|nr:thiopurine S-methyltransferase [Woeseiaceae bacterium]